MVVKGRPGNSDDSDSVITTVIVITTRKSKILLREVAFKFDHHPICNLHCAFPRSGSIFVFLVNYKLTSAKRYFTNTKNHQSNWPLIRLLSTKTSILSHSLTPRDSADRLFDLVEIVVKVVSKTRHRLVSTFYILLNSYGFRGKEDRFTEYSKSE